MGVAGLLGNMEVPGGGDEGEHVSDDDRIL